MKASAAILVLLFGSVLCSLEPASYRAPARHYLAPHQSPPPANRYIPAASDSYRPQVIDARRTPPSTSYGVPDYRGSYAQQRQQEQYEPAKYDFGYQVRDNQGNDYGHHEARDGSLTRGTYSVLLPDGRRQVVEYEADEAGFRPRISYETSADYRSRDRSAYPAASY